MCLIIFLDGDTPFSADTISSHYCQVFAIVRPILRPTVDSESGVIGYNLSFIMKNDVPNVPPELTSSSFAKNDAFFLSIAL